MSGRRPGPPVSVRLGAVAIGVIPIAPIITALESMRQTGPGAKAVILAAVSAAALIAAVRSYSRWDRRPR
jgi:hypothetical protein